ncbi:MAG: hypothetical protein ACHQD9_08410, partial [Chitinophagales bacterium]
LLQRQCAEYEKKLLGHLEIIRRNPVRMAVNSILPFEDRVKNGVLMGLELVNDTILPVVLGATFKKGKDNWTKNILQIAEALIVSWSFKFFRKILAKKKSVPEEKVSVED